MVYLILGTIFAVVWCFIYAVFRNKDIVDLKSVNEKEFFMQEIFFIGFGIYKILGINENFINAKKKILEIENLKGFGKGQAYYNIILFGKITYALTFLPIILFIAVIIGEKIIIILGISLIVLLCFYLDYELNSQTNNRKEDILNELPKVLSKIAVLMSAGISLRSCWRVINNDENKELYREIQILNEDIKNGVSEIEAYRRLGERCNYKEIKKFTSTVCQNLQKGNADIVRLIRDLANNSWQEKKYKVKVKGEIAGSKLMVPMIIMLASILIMIIIPIFDSL